MEMRNGMRNAILLLVAMGATLLVAGTVALAASISCPNASGGYCYGTSVGDGMYGTAKVDRMYGYGGADLAYGYASGDRMLGGNETGWGDKMLGQRGGDYMNGNRGDDALYGGDGDDTVYGGRGDDLIQGGYGNDALYTGFGDDQVNAQDGQKDLIFCGSGRDLIYLDRELDVLRDCATSRAELSRVSPPEDLFAHTGMVLVKHDGEGRCLPEKKVKGHLEHGDEIINPAGCSDAEEGRE
jgi:hypothetical protein